MTTLADNDQQGNEPVATNSKQLLAQIDASIAKTRAQSVKQKATEIKTKIAGHELSIRQLEAELNDLLAKFEAGVI